MATLGEWKHQSLSDALSSQIGCWRSLAGIFLQRRLGIEQVHLQRAARYEQNNGDAGQANAALTVRAGRCQTIRVFRPVTTDANPLASKIHNRMPVLLDEHDYDAWLDPENQDGESLQYLFEPFPVDRMSVRPVSTFVNNARHERPECIADASGDGG